MRPLGEPQLLHLVLCIWMHAPDHCQDTALFLLLGRCDQLSGQGSCKDARIHCHCFQLACDHRVCDKIQVFLGHTVNGEDPASFRHMLFHQVRKIMLPVHQILHQDGCHFVLALLFKEHRVF